MPVPPLYCAIGGTVGYASFVFAKGMADSAISDVKLVHVSVNETKETVVALLFLATAIHIWKTTGRRLDSALARNPSAPAVGQREGRRRVFNGRTQH